MIINLEDVLVTCNFCSQKLGEVSKKTTLEQVQNMQHDHNCIFDKKSRQAENLMWVNLDLNTFMHRIWKENENKKLP